LWACPNGDGVDLKINIDGKWVPIGGNSCKCTDVVIAHRSSTNRWRLAQGSFENTMAAFRQGMPINISIWDTGNTAKPHSIKEYFPVYPDYPLPPPYNNL